MSTIPNWRDSEQADLLELVALGTPQGEADKEWDFYCRALEFVAIADDGYVLPNTLRGVVRGKVVHDYAVVRGDLCEQYARDQLSDWVQRYAEHLAAQAVARAFNDIADEIRVNRNHRTALNWREPKDERMEDWLRDRARDAERAARVT